MKKTICVIILISTFLLTKAQMSVTLETSNLPIFIINTKGGVIVNDPKITANLKIIYNGKNHINKLSDKNYHYNNDVGIEIRGNSSQSFPQQQYSFETRDSITAKSLDVPLLDMPADNDWVLYAPYNDVSMLRNPLTYHIWNKMGHWGPRTKFCEVIINGDYKGIYILVESIKRGGKRVDIAKLESKDTSGINLTGGYIIKIDKQNSVEDKGFISKHTSGGNPVSWLFHYPKPKDIQPQQEAYIQSFIDSVENTIHGANFADTSVGYAKYLSLSSFIDYFIICEITKNIDAYKASTFFYKEKRAADGGKGKLKAGPVWDYNFAFGNGSFCEGGRYTSWQYQLCSYPTLPVPTFWARLLQDPNFANKVKCRYTSLRTNFLSETYINNFLDAYAFDTLSQAQVRHFTRWRILGTNPGGFNAYTVASYNAEIKILKDWVSNRLEWIDANLGGTCSVTTSLHDQFFSDHVEVYPVPFSRHFFLKSTSSDCIINSIEMFNAMGQQIYMNHNIGQPQIYLSGEIENLSVGVYRLECQTSKGRVSKMIFKK